MQLAERHIIISRPDLEIACKKAKDLYNQVIYYLRQSYFGKIQRFSEFELSNLMCHYNDPFFRSLPSNISQQIIKYAFGSFSSFYKTLKSYNKNPHSFNGKPKIPKYKKELAPVYFTRNSFRIKDGIIFFAKHIIKPLKTNLRHDINIKQIRIIPQATCFVVEIIYEKDISCKNLTKTNFLSIDFGVDNFATCISNVGKPFIVNGKIIKSFNQWFNKKNALFQTYISSSRMSNRIKSLQHYRNCWIEDKMHKVSRFIIYYCIQNDIGTITIGKNNGWKQRINMGRSNNQKFCYIPYARMISKIKYKAELVGIKVLVTEESYTSKIDHLAHEPLRKQAFYLGKRIKRGLFQSSSKKLINADVNGAIGIARKVFGDTIIKLLVDSGVGGTPYRMNIL